MSLRPVLQLEFNELSPVLLDRFIGDGLLPHFKSLRDSSRCFTTDASGETQLEPWTQWPTLHTGIPDSVHGLHDLGEAGRLRGKGIAREIATAGYRVGIFGSMNVAYGPLGGFTIPDPWNPDTPPHPSSLRGFTDFVVAAVQESSTNALDKQKAAQFMLFAARNGLSEKTVRAAVAQLLDERRSPGVKWRRPMILDVLGFDVFRSLIRKYDVSFATFFSNSTAHLMHYFWRNMEPDGFSAPPPSTDDPSLADAVLTGYQRMDALIGTAMKSLPGWRLSLATALSQEAWDTDKSTWRPKEMASILDLAGIPRTQAEIQPVMAEQFFVAFSSPQAAQEGLAKLDALTVDGQKLLRSELEDTRVKTGCAIMTWNIGDPKIEGPTGTTSFRDTFYMVHGIRSGHHHPDGIYWVQSSSPGVHAEKVPLTAVAPTVLSLFGIDAPDYMKEQPLPVAL